MTNTHTHDEYDDRTIHREVVRSNLKRKAEEDLHIKPNKLIRRELKNNDKSEHLQYSDMKLIQNNIYLILADIWSIDVKLYNKYLEIQNN